MVCSKPKECGQATHYTASSFLAMFPPGQQIKVAYIESWEQIPADGDVVWVWA
jgi:hypothetical protein